MCGAADAALHKACAQPTFTTRADFAVDVVQVPVTFGDNHGSVIGRLISVSDFLY